MRHYTDYNGTHFTQSDGQIMDSTLRKFVVHFWYSVLYFVDTKQVAHEQCTHGRVPQQLEQAVSKKLSQDVQQTDVCLLLVPTTME